MARSNKPAFKSTRWYKPLYLVLFLACSYICIGLLHSGGLAAWDRYSPEKVGPQLSLFWSAIIGMPVGLVIAFLLMLQLELFYERWRDSD